MKALGWTTHVACVLCVLAGIWIDGYRLQFIGTALVLLLIGAVLIGTADIKAKGRAKGGEIPNSVTYSDRVPEHLRDGDSVAGIVHEAESYGPRRTYGKKDDR